MNTTVGRVSSDLAIRQRFDCREREELVSALKKLGQNAHTPASVSAEQSRASAAQGRGARVREIAPMPPEVIEALAQFLESDRF
jgi:hypothetical protein